MAGMHRLTTGTGEFIEQFFFLCLSICFMGYCYIYYCFMSFDGSHTSEEEFIIKEEICEKK
jgi:hypothetical protein